MTDYRLCAFNDIEEEASQEFVVPNSEKDISVFAVKKDGLLSVFLNSCPHLGIPMNMEPDRFLDVEKAFIACSTHGALFKIEDGECVSGPCFGEHLQVIPHEVRDEEVFISKDL